jgi:transcriptional regulator with XRE-family HTH domain
MANLSPIRWVRQKVFGVTQDELAAIGGVSRPRVSRYETVDDPPFDFLKRLRAEAARRGLPFSADWFFEIPHGQPFNDADERAP